MKKLIVPAAAALGVLLTVGVASADPNCDYERGVAEGAYGAPTYATPYTTQYPTSYVAPAPYPTSYGFAAPRVVVEPSRWIAPRLPIFAPRPIVFGRWHHHGWGWRGHHYR